MSHCTWNFQHIWNRFRMFTSSETRSRSLYVSCLPSLSGIVSTPEAWSCFAHLCQVLCQLLKLQCLCHFSATSQAFYEQQRIAHIASVFDWHLCSSHISQPCISPGPVSCNPRTNYWDFYNSLLHESVCLLLLCCYCFVHPVYQYRSSMWPVAQQLVPVAVVTHSHYFAACYNNICFEASSPACDISPFRPFLPGSL